MNDKNLAMVLTTAIVAPVMIVCCGGGRAFLGSALASATWLFMGSGGLPSHLLAIAVGGLMLGLLHYWRSEDDCKRPNSVSEPRS